MFKAKSASKMYILYLLVFILVKSKTECRYFTINELQKRRKNILIHKGGTRNSFYKQDRTDQ